VGVGESEKLVKLDDPMSQKFHGVSASIFLLLFLSPSRAQQVVDFPAAKTGGNYMHNYYLPPPSSTPYWPAWSPSGEEIAFSMQGSIWKIRPGDSTAYELTSAATYDSSPAWSPDGKWIVYTAEQDSRNINLRILNLWTGETHALTAGEGLNLDPVWSPDGTRIAYISTLDGGWFNIFVLPIADDRVGEAIQLTRARDFGRDRLYFGRMDLQIEPTWSPDGKEIIFLSNQNCERSAKPGERDLLAHRAVDLRSFRRQVRNREARVGPADEVADGGSESQRASHRPQHIGHIVHREDPLAERQIHHRRHLALETEVARIAGNADDLDFLGPAASHRQP
jgi:dipeptidyl aminopeptidase/acylaminoacyl peptidase